MNLDEALIDRIVRGVVEQIHGRSGAIRAAASARGGYKPPDSLESEPAVRTGGSPPPLAESEQGTVLLEEKVITGELLAGRLNGAPRVQIGANSVLTPSARDVLRQRGIEWRRNTEVAAGPTTAATWKAIVVQASPGIAGALEDAGRSAKVEWNHELAGDVGEAVRSAVSSLCRADAAGVVVFARDAAAVACRANRNEKVRGAVIGEPREIESLKQQMGANLFCIDADGRSYFELRNLLRAIAAGGPPHVPESWESS